ncbi:hypothetical protein [Enterobacter cloacae complex sp. 363J6]|jgi:hypothetical protein|uniref:Uncharacterized protein n=3 Tax=Pseudotevenvirus TaxID=2842979 RepID=A0A1B1IXW7_9CAUD|nr:hypothetical protein BI032_gp213 [Citrobacter phage vB_CfrM_CfP1]QJI53179.1 hypothetical protein EBPL_00138 [Enterobacter phage EBPL]QPX73006.1 hypothetical protein [Citrobacter phage vB_Cfr_Xman]QTJ24299.1 hypothetical protein [Enterobacter phage PF-CE2]WAW44664.1 hypothetical protein [Klebsiella phage Kp_GWPR59]ANS06175.1 hypothetical protein ABCD_0136 [Citrobacter phage vB_CfrM_CfP1]
MSKKSEVAEIKKLDDGKIAVRWKGNRKFNVIEDPEVAAFLVFMITQKDTFVPDPNNIRLAD